MRQLLPDFIVHQYQQRRFQGQLHALTMFIDISGFTRMTETLMTGGEEGAEILSDILNRLFTDLENAVYGYGGFISTFAGDAFTAIFPEDEKSHVVRDGFASAFAIQAVFHNHCKQHTKFGDFEFEAKIGLSHGLVEWGIVGGEDKAYFFRGQAIDACAAAEHHAVAGEIRLHPDLNFDILADQVELTLEAEGFHRLIGLANPPESRPIHLVDIPGQVAESFLPESVCNFNAMGEFRNAVSIFASISAFDPAGFPITALSSLVTLMFRRIKQFGGYFNKIDFGDKGCVALCVFGAPTAYERNLDRALDWILAVKSDLLSMSTDAPLIIKMGVAYGAGYAGIIGGPGRCEYTVIGDVVNLSSRLMVKAPAYEVWVSEAVFARVNHAFDLQKQGEHVFKGMVAPQSVYRLDSKKVRAEKHFSGQFVGRTAEIAAVENAFKPLWRGQSGGVVHIYGEPGVGKSRFVFELKQRFPAAQWLFLPCDGIIRKPFNPLDHFFYRFFQQSAGQTPEKNRKRFEIGYNLLIQAAHDPAIRAELTRLKSILAGFLGLPNPGELYEQLDAKLRFENTLYAFKEVFKAISLRQPVIIELEDMQWIDDVSRQAFAVICRNIEDFPICVLGIGRYFDDRKKPRLQVEATPVEIDLNTLPEHEVTLFINSRLEGTATPELLRSLSEKTQGNPFFLEQTIQYFRETGLIRPTQINPAMWELNTAVAVSIPATITDLLIARIDRLSDRLKQITQTASVIGKEFDVQLLSDVILALDANAETDLKIMLHSGEDENLWTILAELRGIFNHALLQNTAYHMQLTQRRRDLHKIVAECIERLAPNLEKVYADLALHYERAEVDDKAREYLKKAADYSKDRFENEKAIELYDRLLALLEKGFGVTQGQISAIDIQPHNQFLLELYGDAAGSKGDILKLIGRYADALEILAIAEAIAEKVNDIGRFGSILSTIGLIYYSQGDYNQAAVYYEKRLRLSESAGDTSGVATAKGYIGGVYLAKGLLKEAVDCFEVKLKLSQELQNKKEIAIALGNIGMVHDMKGEHDRALDMYERQLAMSNEISDRLGLSNVNINKGCVHYALGQLEAARHCFQTALTLSTELGYKREIAIATGNLGEVYCEFGQYEEAISCLEKRYAISEELGEKAGKALALGFLGIVYHKKGENIAALDCTAQALQVATELEMDYDMLPFLVEKAELLYEAQRIVEAANSIQDAVDLATNTNQFQFSFRLSLLQAKIALPSLTDIEKMFTQFTEPEEQALLNYEFWQFNKDETSRQKAYELYRSLYDTFGKFDYKRKLDVLSPVNGYY